MKKKRKKTKKITKHRTITKRKKITKRRKNSGGEEFRQKHEERLYEKSGPIFPDYMEGSEWDEYKREKRKEWNRNLQRELRMRYE